MADFGNAGKRTVHESEAACIIDGTSGESIVCTLDVRGALPLFRSTSPAAADLPPPADRDSG